MSSPPSISEWSFESNNRLYHSLTQEQRDTNLQPLLPLTTNFSLDYPTVCKALNVQPHPTLLAHVSAFQLPLRPVTPAPPATVTSLPLPDTSVTSSQPALSPPVSARKSTVSPRPTAASIAAAKGGKKVEAKTPAGKAGKKEEVAVSVAVAVVEEKKEEKKEDVPADERDTIALTHTSIDDGTMAALAITLAVNRHIRCLRLQFCGAMTDAAVRMLPAIVSKSCVQRLYVDSIALTQPMDSSTPHPLLAILPALATSNVQLLSMSANHLTDADGAAIAASLTTNTVLGALTLSNNHLAASTAAALSAALLLNTTLAYLNLSRNPLTTPHLVALLAPFTHAAIEPPPKTAAVAPAKGASLPPPPYRVQSNKDTKSAYREANGTLRQLWCDGCAVGGTGSSEVVERVRAVLAARAGAVEGGEAEGGGVLAGAGQCNGLERLGLQWNDWDANEWTQLCALSPVVVVESERGSKHVRACGTPLPSTMPAMADAVDSKTDVAAA